MSNGKESWGQPAEKERARAALRQVLAVVARWTDTLFGAGAAHRLSWIPSHPTPPMERFFAHGSAGRLAENSPLFGILDRAWEFGHSGRWHGTVEDLKIGKGALFPLETLLRNDTALVDEWGSAPIDPDGSALLLQVMDRFNGRLGLAYEQPLTIVQLAAIAHRAEKTVRMLAKPAPRGAVQKQAPAVYTHKTGHQTWVSAREALRWLRLRSDFQPTQLGPVDLEPKTRLAFAATLRQLRDATGHEVEEIISRSGLPKSAGESYEALECGWWAEDDIDFDHFREAGMKSLAMSLGAKHPERLARAGLEILEPFSLRRKRVPSK